MSKKLEKLKKKKKARPPFPTPCLPEILPGHPLLILWKVREVSSVLMQLLKW